MIVSRNEALAVFEAFEPRRTPPSLHPDYLIADATRDPSARPVFFVHRDGKDSFYHPFLMRPVPGTDFSDIESAYGYGGPLSTSDDPAFLERAHQEYLAWCRHENVLVEFVRFHPLLENWRWYRGEISDNRQTVWIDLRHSDLLASFDKQLRYDIRATAKLGLTTRIFQGDLTDGIKHFIDMYHNTMSRLNAVPFYFFSDEYFNNIASIPGVFLVLTFDSNKPMAGALFLSSGSTVEYHLSASEQTNTSNGATKLLIHDACHYAKCNGYSKLHLGGGTKPGENNKLFFFKSRFSRNRATFFVGKIIHNMAAYNELRNKSAKSNETISPFTIFYR